MDPKTVLVRVRRRQLDNLDLLERVLDLLERVPDHLQPVPDLLERVPDHLLWVPDLLLRVPDLLLRVPDQFHEKESATMKFRIRIPISSRFN